jgi:hypothetical protein
MRFPKAAGKPRVGGQKKAARQAGGIKSKLTSMKKAGISKFPALSRTAIRDRNAMKSR